MLELLLAKGMIDWVSAPMISSECSEVHTHGYLPQFKLSKGSMKHIFSLRRLPEAGFGTVHDKIDPSTELVNFCMGDQSGEKLELGSVKRR